MCHLPSRCCVGVATWLALALPPAVSSVQASEAGAGTYGAPFLRIPVGPRLIASTGVVVGMNPDASALFSNPAFLSDVRRSEVFFSTANWLDDLRFSAASVAFPVGDGATTVSVGSMLLYSGGLQGYDAGLNVVSEDNYYDLGVTGAASHRLGDTGFTLGAGATFLRQHLVPEDGTGYAMNVGASWRRGATLVHASANNVLGNVSFASRSYAVDGLLAFGAGHSFATAYGRVFAGAQMVRSEAAPDRVELGVDYQPSDIFTLRTAFHGASGSGDGTTPITAGLGVHYGAMTLEYAYAPHEYFSGSHTFALVFGIGRGAFSSREEGAPRAPSRLPHDEAPVISPSQIRPAPPEVQQPIGVGEFILAGGDHGWLDSARAEVRALTLLGVESEIVDISGSFRVVVGRYSSFVQAEAARKRMQSQGHLFRVLSLTP